MPDRKQATIDDVARLAGVSPSTVSRVVNNSAPVVSETYQKVQEAILALNYKPSSAARGLANRKTNTIGLIVPEISEAFFVPLLRGIESAASRSGYNLLIQTTNYQYAVGQANTLGEQNTDGVLVFSESLTEDEIIRLAQSGFPMVLIHQEAPAGTQVPSITIENKEGARKMVTHLIREHGRQRIVFLSGPQGVNDSIWREKGYRQALEENDLPYDAGLVLEGGFQTEQSAASLRNLIKSGIVFDAVFAGDDGSAFGALKALREAGITVPDVVSVGGFDDVTFADQSVPALTTVHAPTEQVGQEAVKLLLALIDGQPAAEMVLLPTDLVLRRSCGCK